MDMTDATKAVQDGIRVIEALLGQRGAACNSDGELSAWHTDQQWPHYFNQHSEVRVDKDRVLESRKVLDRLREVEAHLGR